jgi:hypothetical protein
MQHFKEWLSMQAFFKEIATLAHHPIGRDKPTPIPTDEINREQPLITTEKPSNETGLAYLYNWFTG